jgi:undecaprenyl-diphosphatase
MLENIDFRILEMFNQVVGQSYWRDNVVQQISHNNIFKGVPVFMLWWGLWFAGTRSEKSRTGLMAVIVISVAAIFVGRLLALLLPFRLRPIHDPELDINLPYGISERTLEGLSSMPSDHAVLFFSLAVGIFFVHRIAGIFLILHAILVISLPRIYMAVHYPGDILAGAIVGVLIAVLLFGPVARLFERLDLARLAERHAAVFYPILFLITFQSASMFDSARELLEAAGTVLKQIFAA